MARTARIAVLFLAVLSIAMVGFSSPADGGTPKNVTTRFQSSVDVDGLQAYEIGDILILRGRAANSARAEEAGRVAQSLGYTRVANLIQVIVPADDQAIERNVERQLTQSRGLDGCTISVDSQNGVVHLAGTVTHELQKDLALQLVRSVNGVRAVESTLQR